MMRFRGWRNDHGAEVYCDGDLLELPRLREAGADRESRHSPTGFEWGYGGSGPAELARAILMRVFPGDDLVRHPACYQRFKDEVVRALPREGFTLEEADVRAWRDRQDSRPEVEGR